MTGTTGLSGRTLIKGHGTDNDFLFLVDPDREVELSAAQVAQVCDRRRGIGADGFVRVVRTEALPGSQRFRSAVPEAVWFLDSYNADGSVSDGCGDAVGVLAAVLDVEGLGVIEDGQSVTIGTRAGARTVTRLGELWTVDMGPAHLLRPREASGDVDTEGWDTMVTLPGVAGPRAALSVAVTSPHAVVALAEPEELSASALAGLADPDAIRLEPDPGEATSIELVLPLPDESDDEGQRVGRARVRTLGRGTGQAPWCGTGCCAVAVALHEWEGDGAPQDYLLDLPGGQVGVHVGPEPLAEAATILLTAQVQVTGRITLV